MILRRLRNLWKLSDFEPRLQNSEPPPAGTLIVQNIIKKPTERARFIPRIKQDPVKAITEEPQ